MIVYHGSTERVIHPQVENGRKGLDFGRGFYTTNIRLQAELWANLLLHANGD
ncbi:MAG: DUF3990 domain-containing protein [Bacteroidales bacterium]|nr:DUF3990 domain-containing protein [Bacteroidales bacterium]